MVRDQTAGEPPITSKTFDSRPETYEHIDKVRLNIADSIRNLMQRAHEHDASKLVSPEKEAFDVITPRLKETKYDSPEYWAAIKEMQPAIDHHYSLNRHHPEHFKEGIEGMTLLDVLEMLCDWRAASMRTYGGDLRGSLGTNFKRFGITEQVARIIANTVDELWPESGRG